MCTLILLRRPGHDWPVVLAANRDEMIDRPARPPARHWPDRPEVVAGLDELAGGSWLGLNDHGVVAGILNRFGTLGPAPGQRSRGELVLEALDHADARAAARALRELNPQAYRSFNMIIADNRDAFWLRHADPSASLPVDVRPIAAGLSMIAAGDLDETETTRLVRYRPRFAAAGAPDPRSADWAAWEALLADDVPAPGGEPMSALRFVTARGFATVSSALIALPGSGRSEAEPIFRYRAWQPASGPWQDVLA
ncbi:MAG TPA: NRDE family protein [Stellaceae bacterium]|nr:NRDE family protein [Stellaceae bacterium]